MFSIANAATFFFWTFATVDPVSDHGWSCASAADAACAAVWQQSTPNRQSFCSLAADQWHWTSQDNLVAKFSLVCGDAWKVQFANSMTFFGAFLGAGVFRFLCDRLGRRNPLFLSTALIAVPMLASLAAPSYWAMAGLRAVTGVGAAGQAHCIFLLATEPVGPDFTSCGARLQGLCRNHHAPLLHVGQPAMLIYTAELLPTNCRSTIMGVCSQASRLGSLVAPFLLMLGNQLGLAGHSQVFFPFMVFGSLAVLGGVLTIFMPETLGAAMPENAEDLDDLLSPFTAKPWRRGILALFAFIFRTKAAYAYKTYQCRECRAHTCTCFNEALLDAAAAAAAGEAAGGEAAGGMGEVEDGANESQDDFDDGVAGTGVSGSAELGGGNACDDVSASASADEAAAVVRGTAGSSTSAATSDDSSGKSIAIE
ncbi:hypothetical protein OEZ86_009112 [Tetradesmus obliquus]|nr:hypothetical protein OEZ86_009112 [Tetradesmus obliquus]